MGVRKLWVLIFTNCFWGIYASYHWIVTESGRIQEQVENSGFPLTKNDDLLEFLEQENRLRTINFLYKQLLELKQSIDTQWARIEAEGDLEKRLYATDIDCLLGGVPLSQHNLNTEFLDYGQGSRPKMKESQQVVEPDCTSYSNLDFSMRTFPHLETLNKRDNVYLTVDPMPHKYILDFNIHAMLKQNSSDWIAYNVASLYWRTLGNGSNAVECARRALYFSPMKERYIVLLNLGTLLQELQSLGEAAIVLHSAVDHNPAQYISHLALGNVYAALGDYKRSLACYDNVLSLNPGNVRALQLKHALLCRKKLEFGLLETHFALQRILQDLQNHNQMHEKWLNLQNQVSWERDSKIKEFFSLSKPFYLNLRMLLKNVEHQAKSLNEEVSKRVPLKKQAKHRLEEKNQVYTKPFLDCHTEQCPNYMTQDRSKLAVNTLDENIKEELIDSVKDNDDNDKYDDNEDNERNWNSYASSEYLFSKMSSLINFIKSKYERDVDMLDLKRKVEGQISLKNNLEEMSGNRLSLVDQSLLLNNVDGCMQESSEVKKLN